MITARHARLIGGAIAALLGRAERGSIAFLRCFASEVLDALVGTTDFAVPGYAIFGVVDRADSSLRFITADQAVELREDKDDPILFLIDPQRAGAGLDGIYSAGRDIGEQELFREAIRLARKELPRGHGNFARGAVSAARRIGQRGLVTPLARI